MHTKQRQTQNPHKQREVHKTKYQQQLNRHLRTDSSLSHKGLKCILPVSHLRSDHVVVITQNCLARMEVSLLIEKQSN